MAPASGFGPWLPLLSSVGAAMKLLVAVLCIAATGGLVAHQLTCRPSATRREATPLLYSSQVETSMSVRMVELTLGADGRFSFLDRVLLKANQRRPERLREQSLVGTWNQDGATITLMVQPAGPEWDQGGGHVVRLKANQDNHTLEVDQTDLQWAPGGLLRRYGYLNATLVIQGTLHEVR